MKKFDDLLIKILYYICAISTFLMTIIITGQVLSRYIVGQSLTWSEELGRYLFVWITFLGTAVAVKQGSHVALDLLVNKFSGVSKKVLMISNNGFIFLFGICLTYGGMKLVSLGANQTSPTLELPMNMVYAVIPISGIILLYFVFSETISIIKERPCQEEEGIQ